MARNNFRYLFERSRSPAADAAIMLGAGSFTIGSAGTMEILARAMRHGSHTLNKRGVEQKLNQLGAQLAIRAGDETFSLHSTVLEEDLNEALSLLDGLVSDARLAPSAIKRSQQEVVESAHAASDDDGYLARSALRWLLFGSGSYGKPHLPEPQAMPSRSEVISAYQTLLAQRRSAGVTAARDARALRQIVSTDSTQSSGLGSVDVASSPTSVRAIIIDRQDRAQCSIRVGVRAPTLRTPMRDGLAIANTVFASGFSSRLIMELREKRGLTYGASAAWRPYQHAGMWSAFAHPELDRTHECVLALTGLIQDFVERGPTASEVSRAKKQLVNGFPFLVDTANKRLFLRMESHCLDLKRTQPYVQRIRKASLKSTRDAASSLGESAMQWVIVGPANIAIKAFENVVDELHVINPTHDCVHPWLQLENI